jgi:hypothetical protein
MAANSQGWWGRVVIIWHIFGHIIRGVGRKISCPPSPVGFERGTATTEFIESMGATFPRVLLIKILQMKRCEGGVSDKATLLKLDFRALGGEIRWIIGDHYLGPDYMQFSSLRFAGSSPRINILDVKRHSDGCNSLITCPEPDKTLESYARTPCVRRA